MGDEAHVRVTDRVGGRVAGWLAGVFDLGVVAGKSLAGFGGPSDGWGLVENRDVFGGEGDNMTKEGREGENVMAGAWRDREGWKWWWTGEYQLTEGRRSRTRAV
ncbi:hypothetical protein N7510_001966 [Penicillium lagena]|uniref:uncharacterized protein n=1 Tax=Penicillium lagena TaxID=94218 RepID=UPI002541BCD6|nr:uncharacterized protein N7510_001966 [Penicillium lagena]KAJ5625657.1 hypothetical protein N7510_001966 [Penicillium lagena]